MPAVFNWDGAEIELRARRAYGRGTLGIGEAVANDGKRFADVLSGTMMRSIHVAKADYTGGNDEEDAGGGNGSGMDLLESMPCTEPSWGPAWASIQVGSWVAYACVEEVGRGHQFMQPAVELVSGMRAEALMTQAFAEEGFL